jgi:hypothetical protein
MGRPPTNGTRCTRCKERWSQSRLGLCRTCERIEFGEKAGVAREREHVVMMQARELARLSAAGRARYSPPQTYTVVAEGREYEVVNDRLGFGRAFVNQAPAEEGL